jgi:hypothetical protein
LRNGSREPGVVAAVVAAKEIAMLFFYLPLIIFEGMLSPRERKPAVIE